VIEVSRNYTIRQWKSRALLGLCAGSLLVALLPLLSILWEVFSRGIPVIDTAFLFERQIFQYREGGGVANAVVGSFYITGLASLIGIPVGVMAGIYLSEYGHGRFAGAVRFFSDVFAEFPSIVIGLFAYVVVVGVMGHFSILAGAIALAVMMIPIVTRTTEESLHLVPNTIREAALALGIPKWRTTLRVTLSTARAGLVTGSMLAFARIFGETAPLIVTIGGSLYFADSIEDTSSALTYVVWRGATSGIEAAETRAWGAAALLLLIVLAINVFIRFVTLRRQAQGGAL
jgi:phosphate transport system permease protein